MRVLHLMPARPFGGLQRVALDLARAQQEAGLKPSVLAIYRDSAARALSERWQVEYAEMTNGSPTLRAALELRSMLRDCEFDILHVHEGVLWSTCLLRGQFSRRPIVAHLHSFPSRKSLKGRLQNQLLAGSAARMIAVSRAVGGAWLRVMPWLQSRLTVIYNGIPLPDAGTHLSAPGPDIRYGMATRLDRSKGVFEFIEAAAVIARVIPKARFLLAGEGPERQRLTREVRRRGLADRFVFRGYVANVEGFWRNEVDVALFTSPEEAFGLRLIEPVAVGRPVVAFRNGSGSDEIIDRCRGIFAAPWGDYRRFAELAAEIATDHEALRQRVTQGMVDLREHFSLDRMEKQVRAAYHELLP